MITKPPVSIIITTKNEEQSIANLLNSVNKQSYKNIEVLVVDNYSTDKTFKIVKKYDVKAYTRGPERSAQRNFGAKKARGKYLLFLDADMELSKKVIEECVEKVNNNPEIGTIVIPEVSIATTFWEKVKAFERSFYNESGDFDTDAARFISKEAFKKAGGYDETITGPEDWDLPETIRELGYKAERIKAVIYHHERLFSIWTSAKKKFYYGLRAHRYLNKHKIPALSPKTIYFLRWVFYKKWRKIVAHPILSLAMFSMLTLQMIMGGLGFILGKVKRL